MVVGGRPVSTNSDVVGVALEAPRIQWAAECHNYCSYGMEVNLTWEEDWGNIEARAEDKLDEVSDAPCFSWQ